LNTLLQRQAELRARKNVLVELQQIHEEESIRNQFKALGGRHDFGRPV
jgi:hypothetical protein